MRFAELQTCPTAVDAEGTPHVLRFGHRLLSLVRPQIMTIFNLTPDSFYDGGRLKTDQALLAHAEAACLQGAAIFDLGGCSTRPGAEAVTVAEEIRRLREPLAVLRPRFPDVVLSVDTFRVAVAEAAVAEGADLINDVSGGQFDEHMFEFIIRHRLPYVLMHMRGTPQDMMQQTDYGGDVLGEVFAFLHNRLRTLREAGLTDVIVDPGFGFAKDPAQSFHLLRHLSYFKALKAPLLVGLSRKSMIYRTLDSTPAEVLSATAALQWYALQQGATLLRVHDTAEARQVITLHEALRAA